MAPPKTRLDPVVKLEEQREELSLRAMAEAARKLNLANKRLSQAKARASADERRRASASDWQLAELSHTRALLDARVAEQEVRTASQESGVTRDAYAAVHSKAESLRRAAAARKNEITQQRETAERREQDELAILRHGKK